MNHPKSQFKLYYSLSFAWQLGFLIAAPLVLLLLIGYWLDRALYTSPFFILTGVFGGMIFSAYEIYHLIAPLISNNHHHGTH